MAYFFILKMESRGSSKALLPNLPVTQHNIPEDHKSNTAASNLLHIHQHSLCVYTRIYIHKSKLLLVGERWDCKSANKPHQLAYTKTLTLVCRLTLSMPYIQWTFQVARSSTTTRLNFLSSIQFKQHKYTGTKCFILQSEIRNCTIQ